MMAFPLEEDIDLREIILSHVGCGHKVVFMEDVTVKTYRFEPGMIDGVYWNGTLEIKDGESFSVQHISRGEKRKPCRLNTLIIPTSEFGLHLKDVPENSYLKE